jgi:hypothetical protein
MKRLALLWGLGVPVCTPMSAFATSYSSQTVISPADPNLTQRLGINNATTIADYSGDGINLPNKGFTLVLPNTFTSGDSPRSTQAQVVGINNVLTSGVFETVGFSIDSTSAQVPKTAHVADLRIQGARSAFAAPATGLQPVVCDYYKCQ